MVNIMSGDLYIEAMLNNSSAPNSAAKISNPAPRYTAVNTANYFSLQATDVDGDSLVYTMISPRSCCAPNPVTLGFSSSTITANQPMGGTGSALIPSSKLLRLQGSSQGLYAMVIRTSEYRNGVVVGYTERDFAVYNINVTNPKIPVPSGSSSFVYNACPGQPASLSLSFVDSNASDSVVIASIEPSIPLSVSMSGGSGVGSATGTLYWTTPASLNPATTPYFYLRVKVRDNACPMRGLGWYDVLVNVKPCNTDTVWPGDADANYVVDLYDPLSVAVAFGKTGATRPGATLSWNAQQCPNWTTSFADGVNHKHADCDGNGSVGASDLTAITNNYGQSHPKEGDYLPTARVTGLPDLHMSSQGVAVRPGATVTIPIVIGAPSSQINNFYGLACRLRILNLTPATAPTLDYTTSWLGTTSNTLRFSKTLSSTLVDWAYSRTDAINMNGQGALGGIQFTVPANASIGSKVIFRIENARLIDKNGTVITAYNVVDDTAIVVSVTSPGGVENMGQLISNAAVVPNPSSGPAVVQAYLGQASDIDIAITNAVGQTIWKKAVHGQSGVNTWDLPTSQCSSGLYFITMRPKDGNMPCLVRWVVGR